MSASRGAIPIALTLALALAMIPIGLRVGMAAAQPILIGVSAPLAGPNALFGNEIKLGVDQAIADINAAGGLLGRPLRAVVEDDAGDPKKAVEIAQRFARSGVRIVIGPFSSAVTLPASAAYAQAGVLEITPSAIAPAVTDRGLQTVFRICGREDQQADTAAAFLIARHIDRLAIVHDRTTNGQALADAVRKAWADHGRTEAYYGSVAQDSRNLAGLVGRMRAAGAEAVFWGGEAAGAAMLARQIRAAGAPLTLIGGTPVGTDDFGGPAGPAAEGTFAVFPRDPRLDPAAVDLEHRLESRHVTPYAYTFNAYAAVQAVQAAALGTRSLDAATLAAELHSGRSFQTVLGPLAFDKKGDPTNSDLTVYIWRKGPTGRLILSPPGDS